MIALYRLATVVCCLASVVEYGVIGNTAAATMLAAQSCMFSLCALGEKFN